MRGKVLGFNEATGEGLISGDDGQRYGFAHSALQGGSTTVFAGQDVDFEPRDHAATSIFIIRSSTSTDKNKLVAALLAFFLGLFGAHKFYLGRTGVGIGYLLAGTIGWLLILPPMIVGLFSLIEAVIFLAKTDDEFNRDYIVGKRAMF